ncbi:MAG: ATP-binding protein [Clostridia bacterium]|nr:ATP-binding protein [Clostridia bacterium]
MDFFIIDNGVGMSDENVKKINEKLSDINYTDENHIGLYNINKRIKILFGENYGITVKSQLNKGTEITVKIPQVDF